MIWNILVVVSSAIVCAAAVFLVLHQEYDDGLVGRIALSGLAIASFGRGVTIIEGGFNLPLSFVAVTLWLSSALFFARHVYRFLKYSKTGAYSWDKSHKAELS